MDFKGTKTEWEIVEHNWQETSIHSNGKTKVEFMENSLFENENGNFAKRFV